MALHGYEETLWIRLNFLGNLEKFFSNEPHGTKATAIVLEELFRKAVKKLLINPPIYQQPFETF
jgi:hypothetical protein